jgi:hypothetical protein
VISSFADLPGKRRPCRIGGGVKYIRHGRCRADTISKGVMLMLKRLMLGALVSCLMLAAVSPALADAGSSAANLADKIGRLHAWIDATDRPLLRQYLESVANNADAANPDSLKAVEYALQLAEDAHEGGAASLWTDTPFIVYAAPALSPEMRLPDTLPSDGAVSDMVTVVSAQNEYEASSFVFAPLQDVNAVTFTVSDLQGAAGSIPAEAVDLRVVKTWYQGGTAWQSYFIDDTLDVLTPELLLHDENLILVDHEQKINYVRVDYPEGSQYVDVTSNPSQKFDRFKEPVEDSPVLLPIALKQGESKQMWITTKVPAGTPAGLYTGTISITADGAPAGQLTLKIRVLPFELPAPKTYYNPDKDFYVMLFHGSRVWEYMNESGGDAALVDTKLLNEYRNMAEHNAVNIPGPIFSSLSRTSYYLHQLELMREAGLDLDPLFAVAPAFAPYTYYTAYNNYLAAKAAYEANPTEANRLLMEQHYNNWRSGIETHKQQLAQTYDIVTEAVGHTNLYFDGWDEAGWNLLQWEQEMWDYVRNELGVKLFATGNASHLDLEIKENFLNWAGEMTREKADAWHAFGEDKLITSYAYPHIGPENPDLMRQRHGMWLYKANYDATYNYIWYEGPPNVWGENVADSFRAFAFVYPTRTDVIDTIAWEGFREGIDDIRYATKLQLLAREAIASGEPDRVQAAEKALAWLEETDERSVNADYLRLEMIHHILTLIDLDQAD